MRGSGRVYRNSLSFNPTIGNTEAWICTILSLYFYGVIVICILILVQMDLLPGKYTKGCDDKTHFLYPTTHYGPGYFESVRWKFCYQSTALNWDQIHFLIHLSDKYKFIPYTTWWSMVLCVCPSICRQGGTLFILENIDPDLDIALIYTIPEYHSTNLHVIWSTRPTIWSKYKPKRFRFFLY